jgi:hypothetical protein
MSLIKTAPRVLGLGAALVLAAGCDTLNIVNPNAPDSPRLLSDAGTVQAIAVGAMRTWYNTFVNIDPGTTLSVMARSHVAAWNNFQIRFYTGCTLGAWTTYPGPLGTCGTTVGTYPRAAWQNDPASSQRLEIEYYWYGYYSALSSANDVVKAIRVNNVFKTDTATSRAVETMGELVQALSLSELALNYDKGFIVDYTTNLLTLQFSGRAAMRDAALAKFDTTIALATAAKFTVPDAFFDNQGVVGYNNVKIAQLANTMAARLLAYYPRSAAENADKSAAGVVDWARVANYAKLGISSTTTSGGNPATRFDWVFKDDGCVNWCDGLKNWSNDMTTMRVHTRVAHLMDPTTQPDPWVSANDSQPVWGVTSFDKRLGDGTFGPVGAVDTGSSQTKSATTHAGTDFAWSYNKEIQFTARGQWHQSAIGQIRYDSLAESPLDPQGQNNGLAVGPVVLAAENDLIWAEALIRSPTQDLTTAATLINTSRVGRGGLAAAAAGDGTAVLLQKLQYEQDVELIGSNPAPFYNQRRIDNLEPLTPHEFPVPAKELGVLGAPLYTWGGASPPNSPSSPAPSPAASVRNASQIWAQIEREQRARTEANRILRVLR